jgi:hypothetical protein
VNKDAWERVAGGSLADLPDDPTEPSGSIQIDDAFSLSRPDPSGADLFDARYQAT